MPKTGDRETKREGGSGGRGTEGCVCGGGGGGQQRLKRAYREGAGVAANHNARRITVTVQTLTYLPTILVTHTPAVARQ